MSLDIKMIVYGMNDQDSIPDGGKIVLCHSYCYCVPEKDRKYLHKFCSKACIENMQ
jgi:hypothetical protein